MANLLIVEPSIGLRDTLKELLEHEGHTVEASACYKTVLNPKSFDLIINGDSRHILRTTTAWLALIPRDSSVDVVVRAIRCGALNVIVHPLDISKLLEVVREALSAPKQDVAKSATVSATATVIDTEVEVAPKIYKDCIIGEAANMIRLKKIVDTVAPSDARILILGANGTGKELVARRIHIKSKRNTKPLIEVNCAAIPAELIESELFGHEKGSFTSALRQHKGKVEQAQGGTLFLDEIGDMSLSAQAKILRALQERKITRVGSDHDIDVDVRVLAATNKNLREEIKNGNFREDLYHRLGVIVIRIPSIAEHPEDIPLLIDHFIKISSDDYNIVPTKVISDEAKKILCDKVWTGNIREIRNVMERLVILGGNPIVADDIHTYASDVI